MNRIRLTENELYKIISESVRNILSEGANDLPNPNYTHYAINKTTKKIVNGWDYRDVDPYELREFRKDYFFDDLEGYDLNPKDYKILTKRMVEKMGIDINDWENWSNY